MADGVNRSAGSGATGLLLRCPAALYSAVMSEPKLPSLLHRHWAESVLAIGAIIIAAASLWIGYDTVRTNHKLVVAASWPFLEQSYSNATISTSTPRNLLTVDVTNAGIGPAKVESVEVFWHGKAYRSARELLHDCCGYQPQPAVVMITSTLQGFVLRPGKALHLIWYPYPSTDPAPWRAFRTILESGSDAPRFRICYCSAFNQCWLTNGHELDPPPVKVCPVPKVSYH